MFTLLGIFVVCVVSSSSRVSEMSMKIVGVGKEGEMFLSYRLEDCPLGISGGKLFVGGLGII